MVGQKKSFEKPYQRKKHQKQAKIRV